jgi:hypothetical protein
MSVEMATISGAKRPSPQEGSTASSKKSRFGYQTLPKTPPSSMAGFVVDLKPQGSCASKKKTRRAPLSRTTGGGHSQRKTRSMTSSNSTSSDKFAFDLEEFGSSEWTEETVEFQLAEIKP